MSEREPLRVIQRTTGNIARRTVSTVLARDDLELVGVFAYSADKVGVDVGGLCNLGRPVGVTATDDIGALVRSDPTASFTRPCIPAPGPTPSSAAPPRG